MNYRLLHLRADLDRLPEPEMEPGPVSDDGLEIKTPEETFCPALIAAVQKAKTVREVSEAMDLHDKTCPVCNPAVRRAA